jgi:demethylmenaquinone methyltransferase/2-methoxy-6-polyprenyl-1,4-benzoquinol methylase
MKNFPQQGKREYVQRMFDAISPRYDLLNRLLSFGIDRYWRQRTIRALQLQTGQKLLDLATGTGDLAFAAARRHEIAILALDISPGMLAVAGQKSTRQHRLKGSVYFTAADAEHIPVSDDTFDAAMIAFGIRNVEQPHHALRDIRRVLKSGGRLAVLEFSMPQREPLRWLYNFYFRRVLPFVGKRISGHGEAYTYLPESVLRFPEREAFVTMLIAAGFAEASFQTLTGGIATLYLARA